MNIAIFTDFFLPSLGGVQTSIINQKRTLEKAGHTVIVFAPCYGGEKVFEERDGIIRLPTSAALEFDGHRSFLPFPWRSRKVVGLLAQHRIDIVHVQTEFSIGLLGIKLARAHGIPVVYTSHTLLWKQVKLIYRTPRLLTLLATSYFSAYFWCRLPRVKAYEGMDWVETQWLRSVVAISGMADVTITPSNHLARKLAHKGNSGRIIVVPNTTDFDRVPAKPLPAVPTFLWVARFSPEKDPYLFINALRLLAKDKNLTFKAVMCGKGPMAEECRKAAADVPNLSFTSVSHYGEMSALYDASSALVVTSHGFDNQPMTIAEAMTRHRGVVYCDDDLTADGLDGGAGILASSTPDAMAAAMRSLIENPAKLAMMSKIAATTAERFDERHYLRSIEPVYQSLLGKTTTNVS